MVEGPGVPPATSYAMTLHSRPPVGDVVEVANKEVDQAASELDFDGPIERVIEVGAPKPKLAEQSQSVDVIVCGSRAYGLVRQVLLGGVSARLMREAACPVIVTPRTA